MWKGDRVYLTNDPRKEEGTIVEVMHGRMFVQWDKGGRTFIYPAGWLTDVSQVPAPTPVAA